MRTEFSEKKSWKQRNGLQLWGKRYTYHKPQWQLYSKLLLLKIVIKISLRVAFFTAKQAQTSPNIRFCLVSRAHRKTFREGLCSISFGETIVFLCFYYSAKSIYISSFLSFKINFPVDVSKKKAFILKTTITWPISRIYFYYYVSTSTKKAFQLQ